MAKVAATVIVRRPLEELFSFVTNLKNNKDWQAGVVETSLMQEGQIGAGSGFRDVREFLGRRIESVGEVTDYEPNRAFGFKVATGPLLFQGNILFESVEGGSRLIFVGEGEPGGFFKLLEPVVVMAFQKQLEGNLGRLKKLLETK